MIVSTHAVPEEFPLLCEAPAPGSRPRLATAARPPRHMYAAACPSRSLTGSTSRADAASRRVDSVALHELVEKVVIFAATLVHHR